MCESFRETDPEFSAFFEDFACQQAPRHCGLTEPVRFLVLLSALDACGGPELYASTLNDALDAGLTPVQAREILYHTVPYAGYARVQPCFAAANQVFRARGVALPLPAQSTTTPATRFEKGLAVQKQLFGAEQIETMRASAPADQKPIQYFLSANCFGDYYTRGGLDAQQRELVTFAALAAMGGCEPQLTAHIRANLGAGNDRSVLMGAVTALVPYIGYPRSLNAIRCITEVTPNEGETL